MGTRREKYYTPSIEEFHVGFEFERRNLLTRKWAKSIFKNGECAEQYTDDGEGRVKYLDQEDIESLGFVDKEFSSAHFNDRYCKIEKDNKIIIIQPYYNMRFSDRENLVRIYKGVLGNYPYEEIFRGDIKNKSELKKVLKMVGVYIEK